jgi:hypothetical protein
MLRGNDYVIARPKHWVGTHTLTIQTHSVDCNRISLGRCRARGCYLALQPRGRPFEPVLKRFFIYNLYGN